MPSNKNRALSLRNLFSTKKNERFLFIGPGLIFLFLLVIVPICLMVYLSFTSFTMGQRWDNREIIGLDNYIWLFSGEDYLFYHALFLSFRYVLTVISLSFVIGMTIGLVLNNEKLKFRRLVMVFLIAPIVTSTPVVGLSWRLMFHTQYGIINFFLSILGIAPVNWLGADHAFTAVIIATLWRSGCFMGLIFTAGLQTIPRVLYEAATVDGASGLHRFGYITIPLMKPIILTALLLQSIASIQQFGLVYILTGGGPGGATELLSLHLHKQALAYNGFVGKGAAIAVVLTIFSLILTTMLFVIMRKRQKDMR